MDSSVLLPLPMPPRARTTVVGPGAEGAPCALGMSGSSTDENTKRGAESPRVHGRGWRGGAVSET